jgi:hypothetical protein
VLLSGTSKAGDLRDALRLRAVPPAAHFPLLAMEANSTGGLKTTASAHLNSLPRRLGYQFAFPVRFDDTRTGLFERGIPVLSNVLIQICETPGRTITVQIGIPDYKYCHASLKHTI